MYFLKGTAINITSSPVTMNGDTSAKNMPPNNKKFVCICVQLWGGIAFQSHQH